MWNAKDNIIYLRMVLLLLNLRWVFYNETAPDIITQNDEQKLGTKFEEKK